MPYTTTLRYGQSPRSLTLTDSRPRRSWSTGLTTGFRSELDLGAVLRWDWGCWKSRLPASTCSGPSGSSKVKRQRWVTTEESWTSFTKVYFSFISLLLPTAREGNVFRSVCLFTEEGALPLKSCLPFRGICLQGGSAYRTPQNWHLLAATTAVSTHPSGMHSCVATNVGTCKTSRNIAIVTPPVNWFLGNKF